MPLMKDFTGLYLMFEDDAALRHQIGFVHNVGFGNEHLSDVEYYEVEMETDSGWGLAPWGDSGWGDEDPAPLTKLMASVPTQYRVCAALSVFYKHATAREHFALLSMGLKFRQIGDLTKRQPR